MTGSRVKTMLKCLALLLIGCAILVIAFLLEGEDKQPEGQQGNRAARRVTVDDPNERDTPIRSAPFSAEQSKPHQPSPPDLRCSLRLIVRNETDQPIEGATVLVTESSEESRHTDDQGLAEFCFTKPTRVEVIIRAEGYYPHTDREASVTVGGPRLIVHLIKFTHLCVIVTSEHGPVSAATVQISPFYFFTNKAVEPHTRRGVTDTNGVATFADLGLGAYAITASIQGLLPIPFIRTIRIVKPGSESEVRIEMIPGEVVTVDVVDDRTGQPVSGAMVQVGSVSNEPHERRPPIKSDERGQIRFTRSVGASCLVKIPRHEAYLPAGLEILSDITHAKLALRTSGTRVVRVLKPGVGYISEGLLEIRDHSGGTRARYIHAVDKKFFLKGAVVAQQDYFRIRSGADCTPWAFLRRDTNERELILCPPTVVTGRVLNAINNAPAAGIEVVSWRVVSLGGGQATRRFAGSYVESSSITDASGRFELSLNPRNTYRIRALLCDAEAEDVVVKVERPGKTNRATSLKRASVKMVQAGTRTDIGDIQALEPGSVEVTVTSKNSPLPFANVWLTPADGRFPKTERRFARTDPSGKVLFTKILPGRYYCRASLPSMYLLGSSLLRPSSAQEVNVKAGEVMRIHRAAR